MTATSADVAYAPTQGTPGGSRPREPLAAGTTIGRYELLELLGAGGMGQVYRARDGELAREVALKLMDPGRLSLDDARVRLRREAQAMARVEHAAVVRIYDVGVAGGHLFVAMELVRGGTVAEWLRAATRSWPEVVRVFVEAGRGLAAAHLAGLVHRDIKPGNILLDGAGRARVTDFGLARSLDADGEADTPVAGELSATVTRTGAIAGTPAYMAPEQLAGDIVDARADQFALCVSLWEALCGSRPFRIDDASASSLQSLRDAIAAGRIEVPRAASRVPRRVLAIVKRGLSATRTKRWASVEALCDALERAARPRWPRFAAAAAAVAVVGGIAAAVTLSGGGTHRAAGPDTGAPVAFGDGRTIARTDATDFDVTVLRDGRFLRLERGALTVTAADGSSPRAIPPPDGAEVRSVRGGAAPGHALVVADAAGACRWYDLAVDGGTWRTLLDDPDCERSVDLSPDGNRLAITDGKSLVVRELAGEGDRTVAKGLQLRTPVWSPDGTRLAVFEGIELHVVDADTGAAVAPARPGVSGAWLDGDRFAFVSERSWIASSVHLLDLAQGADTEITHVDSSVTAVSADGHGILLTREDMQTHLSVGSTSPDHALTADELQPLDTGSSIDFIPAGWTDDGAVVDLAMIAGRRGIVRTAPGARGAPLVTHDAPGIAIITMSADRVFYHVFHGAQCEQRYYDLSTGKDAFWHDVPCSMTETLKCAAAAGRCIFSSGGTAHWIDPKTFVVGGPAPDINYGTALAPDASETARIRAGVLVRQPIGGKEVVVPVDPPIPGMVVAEYGPDGNTLYVNAERGGHHQLYAVDRDGHSRMIVDEPHRTLNGIAISRDGTQFVTAALLDEQTWSYLPLVSPGRK